MPDSKYIRIDSVQETDQVYLEITKIFGKEIFAEPYRCVGAFLDIAPKMTEEANYLMKAFSEHVPQDMAAAGSMSKETAQQLVKKLSDKGIPLSSAQDLVEHLGEAMGFHLELRPDYGKGGVIPYAASGKDGLNDAIRKMDHIRWFLNNADHYDLQGKEKVLTGMRKLMNNPQKNEAELQKTYAELIHDFQNDPFQECFTFDGKKNSGLKIKAFGGYFIPVGQTPVAIEFARQYGGTDFERGLDTLKRKSAQVKKKMEDYHREVSSIIIPKSANGSGKGKAVGFVIAALIILGVIWNWMKVRLNGSGVLSIWKLLKANKFAFGKVFSSIPLVDKPAAYITILIVSGLIVMCAIILIVSLIRTIRNISKQKSAKGPQKEKNKLEKVFGTTAPGELQAFIDGIKKYTSEKKSKLNLPHCDYTSQVKKIQGVREAAQQLSRGQMVLVPKKGKNALGWMIFLTIVISIMSATSLGPAAMVSASQMGSIVALKEEISDTVIPSNAMKFGDHYYAVFEDTASWWDAYFQCQKLGGHLATVTSQEEAIAVQNYLNNRGDTCVYAGMWYNSNESRWTWVTGEEMAYADWAPTEPDLGDNQDCFYGVMWENDGYQWRAFPETDDTISGYLCEWDSVDAARVDERVLQIPTNSRVYNGHYYALLSGADTYDDAVKMCEKLGGYMAVVNDWDENVFLYNYARSKGVNNAFFGYTDQMQEGKWEWSATGEVGGYSCWGAGEPNGGTSENYASFYEYIDEYMWIDSSWSGSSSQFICEWDLTQPAAE